ncbi:hypothetical protein [Halomonas halodenitrificans]|uniref:hypothetical protein n=1 Tax=Halomonas halodenitrificans TaxID=28252 RepID=UPI00048796EC|nr:hypothetical protein [Halomonas halodenitrificans]
MHFRVRKQVVQLVRMNYDPAIKRGRAQVVGSVKLANPILPAELRGQLTAQEVAEFDTWVATQHRSHQLKQELAALTLAEQIDQAREWFEQQGTENEETARVLAEETLRSIKQLRRTFNQRGLLD